MELYLGNPAHGGACVAYVDGKVVFVRGGLPGERVEARIVARTKKVLWAKVTKVIEASVERTLDKPFIGGDLSHMTPRESRKWKSEVLRDQLRRVGSADLAEQLSRRFPDLSVEAVPGDEDETQFLGERRTRAQFAVLEDGALAMHEYRSHDLKQVNEYLLLDSVFSKVFTDPKWKARFRGSKEVRLVAPNGSEPLVLTDDKCWNLKGEAARPRATWSVKDVSFEVDARGFWQVHPKGAETLVDTVLSQLDPQNGDKIMELYSGSGLFTRFLAQAALPEGEVASLEGNEQAVADAEANCADINARQIQFFVGEVDAGAIAELARKLGNDVRSIILDPPRAGAGKSVIDAIAKTGAKQVTLIACDPASAARDMEYLRKHGFIPGAIRAWDLFPHTHHFETVATWVRP